MFPEPLRRLTRHTSLGFQVIEFSYDVLGIELLPWQQWWLKHALELERDGGFRFRTVLTLVARQSGKTELLKVLTLAFMFMGRVRLVLGSAQSSDVAREAWQGAVELAESDPVLKREIDQVRRANGEQELKLENGARYRIAATTRSAGRGMSVDLLILDELREQRNWEAWGALSKTTIARPNALTVGITNAGDANSVVLNHLRETALTGDDESIGLFEWSAPEGCDLDDRSAWQQANPGLGHTITEKAIQSALSTDPPGVFRTEVLCQRVDQVHEAVDLDAWSSCADESGSLDGARDRVVACVDVAPDGEHVTLCVAAAFDSRVRVEPVAAWGSTEEARAELGGVLDRVSPVGLVWYSTGPAAALSGVLRERGAVELKGSSIPESCESFADLVRARRIIHPGDALLDAHVGGATKHYQGDSWRFVRRGVGHVDAAYAAAGAAHAVLTMEFERPLPRPMVV